jgi:hypothetical protein
MTTVRDWLLADLTDIKMRLRTQVLVAVPPHRRQERPGGGNSIDWSLLHTARHAELAIAVLGGPQPSRPGGFGLGEVELDTWREPPDPIAIERYALTTNDIAGKLLAAIDLETLGALPPVREVLERANVPGDQFRWLYEQWTRQPRAFFVRWPLLSHQTNHIGEMIATRNRMGLSPFASRTSLKRS